MTVSPPLGVMLKIAPLPSCNGTPGSAAPVAPGDAAVSGRAVQRATHVNKPGGARVRSSAIVYAIDVAAKPVQHVIRRFRWGGRYDADCVRVLLCRVRHPGGRLRSAAPSQQNHRDGEARSLNKKTVHSYSCSLIRERLGPEAIRPDE